MQYIIGIDGGGTKTRCMAATLEGEILFEIESSASNFLSLGTEKVSETIFSLITRCMDELSISFPGIAAIVLGTAGAGRQSDTQRMEKAFTGYAAAKNAGFNLFHVESDARIALEGAFSGGKGSILIAGTGSIIFGKDEEDIIYRAGGFGRLIGDEGGGYSIGKKGLAAVSKQLDGRSGHTLISNLIEEKFSLDSPEKLIDAVYNNNFDIASAAPIVLEAAEKDDAAALRIIDKESDELVLLISSMKKKLKADPLQTAFSGSLISGDNIFSRTLKKKITLRMPDVKITKPDRPPAYGAVLIGIKLLSNKDNR